MPYRAELLFQGHLYGGAERGVSHTLLDVIHKCERQCPLSHENTEAQSLATGGRWWYLLKGRSVGLRSWVLAQQGSALLSSASGHVSLGAVEGTGWHWVVPVQSPPPVLPPSALPTLVQEQCPGCCHTVGRWLLSWSCSLDESPGAHRWPKRSCL